MFNISRYIAVIIVCLTACATMSGVELPEEDLHYSIMYKWGLINKEAGRATLSLRKNNNEYRAMMAARTVPWADKVYRVRDTLKSVMQAPSCLPMEYIKLTHEGNTNKTDILNYTRQGNNVTVSAHRERSKGKGPVTVSDTVLHGTTPAVDMLSVFYYMRHLDFQSMKPGDKIVFDLFSGRKVERLTITFNGQQTIAIDTKNRKTYEITFTFTHNGKESDWPMYAWISADQLRIPLRLEGRLPFGKVQAFYVNATPM